MAIIGISGKIGSGKDTIGNIIQYLTSVNTRIPYLQWKGSEYEYPNCSNWQIRKFADKLKDIVCLLIGCTREQLEDINFKNKELGEEWKRWYWIDNQFDKHRISKIYLTEHDASFFGWLDDGSSPILINEILTPRKIMQLLGTDLLRDQFHPNVHINALFANYEKHYVDTNSNQETWSEDNWIITDVRFLNEAQAIKDRDGIIIRTNRHKRFSEFQFYELVARKLDIYNPNPDRSFEYAEKLDLGYDDATEEYIDEQDIHRGKEHESETALDNYQGFDHVISNEGTIEELVEMTKCILSTRNII